MAGDDPTSADDQQERPGFEQWVVGFVDGEGCFSVHVLHELQQRFGCGRVVLNRRHDDHREDLYRYEVRAIGDLRSTILPFFDANPLRTAKAGDYERFSTVVGMMAEGAHLTVVGLSRIAAIVEGMNHRKPSRSLESSEAIRQPASVDVRS